MIFQLKRMPAPQDAKTLGDKTIIVSHHQTKDEVI
jgi:hypothetical protein